MKLSRRQALKAAAVGVGAVAAAAVLPAEVKPKRYLSVCVGPVKPYIPAGHGTAVDMPFAGRWSVCLEGDKLVHISLNSSSDEILEAFRQAGINDMRISTNGCMTYFERIPPGELTRLSSS